MGQPYHQPLYKREALAAKRNPNARKGRRKTNAQASAKVLWDRYLQARKELSEAVFREIACQKKADEYLTKYGPKHPYWTGCDAKWVLYHFEKVAKLEKMMEARGL